MPPGPAPAAGAATQPPGAPAGPGCWGPPPTSLGGPAGRGGVAADSSRATAPLRAAEDAVQIDSTSHYIEEVIDQICALAREKM